LACMNHNVRPNYSTMGTVVEVFLVTL
jgi:hypothetical protein